MILNNYWAWREACERAIISNEVTIITSMINVSGSQITAFPSIYYHNTDSLFLYYCKNACFTSDLSHLLSDENTPISENDYSINNLTGFRNQTTSVICTLVDGKLNYTFTCSGVNGYTSEQIITRIGIVKNFFLINSWKGVLMAIVELSEPITVPAGSGYSIVVEMIEE